MVIGMHCSFQAEKGYRQREEVEQMEWKNNVCRMYFMKQKQF